MTGQIWDEDTKGGFMHSDELSNYLRFQLIELTKFRQFCDVGDGASKGTNRGERFAWNTYSRIQKAGRRLDETQKMPESNYNIIQNELIVFEGGNSVPYTGKLELLAQHDLEAVIDKTLRLDARNFFDAEAYLQFANTPLRAQPTGGTSTSSITLATNGTPTITNNVALGTGHVKAIGDEMRERSIPPFTNDDYCCLTRPKTLRPIKDQLESIHQHTQSGIDKIYNGEVGRYESFRFVVQNNIPEGGAADSTTFDAYDGVADAWNNGLSSWAFFFGGDTVMEAIVEPEQIRAKIAGDYGRDKGIAWYYLGGFGLVHSQAEDARVIKWDSAA